MCLSCHPKIPAIIAAGSFNGEVSRQLDLLANQTLGKAVEEAYHVGEHRLVPRVCPPRMYLKQSPI